MVNPLLQQMLATQSVVTDAGTISLRHPEFPDRFSHVGRSTGELLQRAVADVQPTLSLEIGLAYGVSTLFICDAIAALRAPGTHIVLDPYQHGKWQGIGLKNVQAAGYGPLIDFRAERSEFALPKMVAEGLRVDLAFIDGLHRHDQVCMEFYFVNRLLRPGGIVLFDDAERPSVKRVIRQALAYPCYELYGSTEPVRGGRSALGALRMRAGRLPAMRRIVRPDVLTRDWDLGVLGRCVGLRKTGEDEREPHWDADV